MNYYHKHLGDYAKDTTNLSMIEHGAYNLLLDRYYGTERGIPADQVYRAAKASTKEERAAVDFVLKEFFQLKHGTWISKRCAEEIAKAQHRIEQARLNGKNGGRPRNPTETQPDTGLEPAGFDSANRAESSPFSTLHSPRDKNSDDQKVVFRNRTDELNEGVMSLAQSRLTKESRR